MGAGRSASRATAFRAWSRKVADFSDKIMLQTPEHDPEELQTFSDKIMLQKHRAGAG
jgi:hypothetical protein